MNWKGIIGLAVVVLITVAIAARVPQIRGLVFGTQPAA